jgi:3-dehydroquinate synthase
LEFLFQYIIEEDYSSVFVLVDTHTRLLCLPELSSHLIDFKLIEIEAGANAKNLRNCEVIWAALAAHYADRKSVLINLGGGSVTDIGGFCAATYKRGIDFINVPTTLLGMIDASIGGKVGIDLHLYKNSVGVFRHPKAIFIYPPFLKTLDQRQMTAGMAEMAKHALLTDKEDWNKFRKAKPEVDDKLDQLINRSVKTKREIVNKDPLEKSVRKVLNFGHTIGHALESYSMRHDSKPLLHGEAIAVGMVCETWLSHQICGLPKDELKEITDYLMQRFPLYALNKAENKELLDLMRNDKKNEEDLIHFSLLKKIGKPVINQTTSERIILDSLQYYQQQYAAYQAEASA